MLRHYCKLSLKKLSTYLHHYSCNNFADGAHCMGQRQLSCQIYRQSKTVTSDSCKLQGMFLEAAIALFTDNNTCILMQTVSLFDQATTQASESNSCSSLSHADDSLLSVQTLWSGQDSDIRKPPGERGRRLD